MEVSFEKMTHMKISADSDLIEKPHHTVSGLVFHYLSRVMRKPTFCICENKDADQLREADQRLCFRYIDSPIPLLSKSEISSL